MSQAQPQPIRFDDRDAFLAWAEQRDGRWERHDGVVQAMAPERVNHTRVKYAAWAALKAALREAGLPCEVLGDGVTVEIDERTDYEPDALIICGDRVDGVRTGVTNPVVVVEVLSPSTAQRDIGVKLDGYFRVPSVEHYLILASDVVRVIHHRRWTDGTLLTRIATNGVLKLESPGIGVPVLELYRDTGLPGAPES